MKNYSAWMPRTLMKNIKLAFIWMTRKNEADFYENFTSPKNDATELRDHGNINFLDDPQLFSRYEIPQWPPSGFYKSTGLLAALALLIVFLGLMLVLSMFIGG